VRAITDAGGALVDRANYRPYGEQLGFGSVNESKGFIGERQDDETGLMYLHARYYDPRLGRFIQPDQAAPYLPGVGINRYAYVFNNPIMFSDPSGFGEGWDHNPNNPDSNNYGGGGGGGGGGGISGSGGGDSLGDVGSVQFADLTITIHGCDVICGYPENLLNTTPEEVERMQSRCSCLTPGTGSSGPIVGSGGGGPIGGASSGGSSSVPGGGSHGGGDGGGGSHGGGGSTGGLFGGGGGLLSGIHTALDLASFVPGLATVTSLANAALYAAEGNYSDAAIAVIGAIPIAGALAVAAKVGIKAIRAARATKGTTTVYRSLNAAGEAQYVGITNNLSRRAAEHLRKSGMQITKVMGGLSRIDARAVEQALISKHGLSKYGGTLRNRINSISPLRPGYASRVRRGNDLLRSIGYR
jgi:RHS repeat-associated protein